MKSEVTQAIVLRTVDVGEADRIVHLLTPDHGCIAGIAKSARKSVKRFPGTLDLLNHLSVELQRKPGRMAYVGKARLVSPFLGMREDPRRYALACYLVELMGRMAPEGGAPDDMRRLFATILSTLQSIEGQTPTRKLRLFVELRALVALGLRPHFRDCVRCSRELKGKGAFAFHVSDGGVLCASCRGDAHGLLPVHLGTLRALAQGMRFELDQLERLTLGPAELAEAETVVDRFHRFHVGIELRSEAFLRETLAAR
jgi:DNA repair protein RecO (recombination protein O)